MNTTQQIPQYSKNPEEIQSIFDKIAPKYDFLNSFLSFNQDKNWRKIAATLSLTGEQKTILDIGTGSGALLEEFLARHQFERAVGADVSHEMLALARKKLRDKADLISLQMPILPFIHDDFDLISSAFVLRSISDLPTLFREVYRVLRPKGRFVILELTRPVNPLMKVAYHVYLNLYLPIMGKIVSGSWNAYQFLSSSIQKFYSVDEYMSLLNNAGFKTVLQKHLTGGICTLVIVEKEG